MNHYDEYYHDRIHSNSLCAANIIKYNYQPNHRFHCCKSCKAVNKAQTEFLLAACGGDFDSKKIRWRLRNAKAFLSQSECQGSCIDAFWVMKLGEIADESLNLVKERDFVRTGI